MIHSFLIFVILPICFHASGEWGDNENSSDRKTHEVKRLIERKKAFDLYMSDLKTRDIERQSKAYKMKTIRAEYAEEKEILRKKFHRSNYDFPYEEYKKFIIRREQSRELIKKHRTEYSHIQKELEKIREDKRYQIDGNKEYNL